MSQVVIFSTASCPRCDKAKALMGKWGIGYDERRVDEDQGALREMLKVSGGARSVPQIVIEDKCIGGLMELTELHMEGDLDHLMRN